MATVRVRWRDAAKTPIQLVTGERNVVVLEHSRVEVLDIEDVNFNFDRSVFLPEVPSAENERPMFAGLGVLVAALEQAQRNPQQRVLVVGHADSTGSASYNQALSEKRARNVYLLLKGDREAWRRLSSEEARADDVDAILAWQAQRSGWDCAPHGSRVAAVRAFQASYNEEVERCTSAGLDLPYRSALEEDGDPGPETWGAFFDVYTHGLLEIMGLETESELQSRLRQVVSFDDLPAFVGCGEHIPFNASLRTNDPGPASRSSTASDRRVEILFFDPEEKPELVCHGPDGACQSPKRCPLYSTREYRHRPIGVGRETLELVLRDEKGAAVPHARYEVRLASGALLTGELDADGKATLQHLPPGQCRVHFPDVTPGYHIESLVSL